MSAAVIRLLEALAAALARADERAELVADLRDEARRRALQVGETAAARWHRRQLAASLAPLLLRRLSPARFARALAGGALRDLRLAFRSLAAAPVFATSVVALLALAIGSHTIVYAVVDGELLRPLPFGDRSDRLITVHAVHPALSDDWDDAGMSYLDLVDVRAETSTLEAIDAVIDRNVSISTGAETQRVLAASMTPGLFGMLGVAPAMGRDFTDAHGAPPGFEQALILSHALWQSLTGGDPRIVGRTLRLNGREIPVVGVMPPGFAFPDGNQLWLPYRAEPTVRRTQRGLLAIGLLRADTSIAVGAAELQAVAARLASRHPDTNRDWSIHVLPIRRFFTSGGDERLLLAAVTLLLIGACANVVGLIVSRGLSRQAELTVRAALGAGRARLVRLLAIENAVLAIAGGAAGLLLARWGVSAFLAWTPEPPPYWALPAVDGRVVLVAVGVTAVVMLVAGVLPAIRIARVDAAGAVLPGARPSGATRGVRRLQHGLVVAQVAASFALLAGAVLVGRSATALLDADGGFDRDRLLSLRVYIPGDQYDPIAARAAAVDDLVRTIEALPGVRAVTATGAIPTDDGGADIRLRVPAGVAGSFDEIGAQLIPVTPSFWQTLGLTLAEGRTFTDSEAMDPETTAVIVNRRLAARLWPGAGAIDRTMQIADNVSGLVTLRIVGVAPDLVYEEFGEETAPSQLNVYVPYVRAGWRTQALLIRTAATPGDLADAVKQAIRRVDPGIAAYDVMTMDDRRAFNHWGDRFVGQLFQGFAAAALLLACIGAYAIAAYAVTQRTREIGVRIAIGAARGDILRLFLGSGVKTAITGAIVGAPLAVATARALEGGLFRVSPWDAGIWAALPVTLIAAVVLASYVPARRASRTDPARTLRQ